MPDYDPIEDARMNVKAKAQQMFDDAPLVKGARYVGKAFNNAAEGLDSAARRVGRYVGDKADEYFTPTYGPQNPQASMWQRFVDFLDRQGAALAPPPAEPPRQIPALLNAKSTDAASLRSLKRAGTK